jgi:CTP synthase (UTP-ammonia lyase)
MTITLSPGSMVARLCGRTSMQEEYRCNFGVNPDYEERLRQSELQIVGSDAEGAVRAVELAGHPFFVGTLFLPQLRSAPSHPHPLISGFIRACLNDRGRLRTCAADGSLVRSPTLCSNESGRRFRKASKNFQICP